MYNMYVYNGSLNYIELKATQYEYEIKECLTILKNCLASLGADEATEMVYYEQEK